MLGLCGVVLGLLLQADWPLWAGILATLLLGTGLGAINGIFIAYLRLPPFLVTLGMLSIARSMALIVSSGEVVYSFGQAEQAIFAIGGGKTLRHPERPLRHVRERARPALPPDDDPVGPLCVRDRRKPAGGASDRLARQADKGVGLHVRRPDGGITSIFLVGWLGSVTNALGQGDELRVIAGTVIGGASLAGGYGTAYGAVIGSLLIEELRNALASGRRQSFLAGHFHRRVHHSRDHPSEISGSRRRGGVKTKQLGDSTPKPLPSWQHWEDINMTIRID